MKNSESDSFEVFLKESLRSYRKGFEPLRVICAEKRRCSSRRRKNSIRRRERVATWTWAGWLAAAVILLAAIFSHIVPSVAKPTGLESPQTEVPAPAIVPTKPVLAQDLKLTAPEDVKAAISVVTGEKGAMKNGEDGGDKKSSADCRSILPTQTTANGLDEQSEPMSAQKKSGQAILRPRNLGSWNEDTLSFADGRLGGTYEETDIRIVSEKVKGNLADFLVVGRWEGDAAVLTDLYEIAESADQAFARSAVIRAGRRYLVRLPSAYGTISYLVEIANHQPGEWADLRWELLSPEAAISALAVKKMNELGGAQRSTKTEIWAKPEARPPQKPTLRR